MNNSLRHWGTGSKENHKYIRKYRSSTGKWIYVYADSQTHDDINSNQRSADFWKGEINSHRNLSSNRAKSYAKSSLRLAKDARNNADSLIRNNSVSNQFKSSVDRTRANINKIGDDAVNKVNEKAKSIGSKVRQASNELSRVPGKIDRAVEKIDRAVGYSDRRTYKEHSEVAKWARGYSAGQKRSEVGRTRGFEGNYYSNVHKRNRQISNEAKQRYDKSLMGKTENALNSAKKHIKDDVNTVKKNVGSAVDNASKKGAKFVSDTSNRMSKNRDQLKIKRGKKKVAKQINKSMRKKKQSKSSQLMREYRDARKFLDDFSNGRVRW